MQQPIGVIIHKVRRLRNLTQKDLAGDRFSKSYVSAIEHNRITPSPGALRFLAERLGQPEGNFTALLQQPEVVKELSMLDTSPLSATNGQIKLDETITLLYTLLEQPEGADFSPHPHLTPLPPDALASFPQHFQARYYFLMGLDAKEKRDIPAALRAFETALTLALAQQQVTILDEMGNCYFLQQAYLAALGYHLHALHLLSKEPYDHTSTALQLKVELHCGDIYRALGAYQQALEYYESARKHLNAQHDLAITGKLYSSLGYCIHAAIYPAIIPSASSTLHIPAEHVEGEFQRAISNLLQSISLYQVSSDRLGEVNVHLMLAFVLLDFSTWRRMTYEGARIIIRKGPFFKNCTAMLDAAWEQCKHMLLGWSVPGANDVAPPAELDTILYRALACLIRISVQRAMLARLEGNSLDVAYRERAFATYWCRQVLNTLSNPSLPWTVIQQAATSSADTLEYRSATLPHFTAMPTELNDASPRSPLSLVEVYFAVAEVAEELGRVASAPGYAHDCYVQANQYFEAALSLARSVCMRGERDPGYLARLYQRCISHLEERALAAPALYGETTKELQGILKKAFWQLQNPLQDNATLQA